MHDHTPTPDTYTLSPSSFAQVPGSPFAYWVSETLRNLFTQLSPFEEDGRVVKAGLCTGDDFRFLRLWWEIPPETLCTPIVHPEQFEGHYCVLGKYRWVPFAKGGAYSPYYADIHLVVNWEQDGIEIKQGASDKTLLGARPQNTSYFFRPGLTWAIKNRFTFKPWTLPAGCIFAHVGVAGFFPEEKVIPSYQGLLSSSIFTALLRVTAGWNFEVGVIQRTPVPDLNTPDGKRIGELALACVDLKRMLDTANETSHIFQLPAVVQTKGQADSPTLAAAITAWQARVAAVEQQLATYQQEIDAIGFRLYGITDEDRVVIMQSLVPQDTSQEPDEDGEEDVPQTQAARDLAAALVSYLVGAAFGRWDVRYATGEREVVPLPDPFAPLPTHSPGMLTESGGDAPALLVDDLDHPSDDIIQRVQAVLAAIWGNHADGIEREVCDLLGVNELREYFRKPTAGGFWHDHIKRYSKSRRKAPIYWLLQSPKKHYAIWLSSHRLDNDLLYKALFSYVEPKLRQEQTRYQQLRQEQTDTVGHERKQHEQQIERQGALIKDIQEFAERLRRAADLSITPDRNDGVVLTIAPLHEVVPWKEAKKYWEELGKGNYPWSSIGRQMREKGIGG